MLKSALKKKSNFTEFENIEPTPMNKKHVKISSGCDIKMLTPVLKDNLLLTLPGKVPARNIMVNDSVPQKANLEVNSMPGKVFVATSTEKILKPVNTCPMLPRKVPLTEDRIKQRKQTDENFYLKRNSDDNVFTLTVGRLPRNRNFSSTKKIYPKSEQIIRRNQNNIKEMDKIKKFIEFSDEEFIKKTRAIQQNNGKGNAIYNNVPIKSSNFNIQYLVTGKNADINLSPPLSVDLPPPCFTPSHNSTFIFDAVVEVSPIPHTDPKIKFDFDTCNDTLLGTHEALVKSNDGLNCLDEPTRVMPNKITIDNIRKLDGEFMLIAAKDEHNFIFSDDEINSMLRKLEEIDTDYMELNKLINKSKCDDAQ